jgi:hypothetical protein
MKKFVWVVLAVLALAVFTPAAHADTYTYTFVGAEALTGTSFTLVDTAGPLTSSETNNDIGFVTASTDWTAFGTDLGPIVKIFLYDDGFFAPDVTLAIYTSLNENGGADAVSGLTDFSTDGTYSWGGGAGTFTISSTPSATVAPEPGSITLVLAGAGLLGLLAGRKQTA